MLPIDPGDGQGSVTPAQPLRDILPAQAMTRGGTTIIRPGAVAWGGLRGGQDQGYSSCEAVERSLGSVARDAGQLPGLLAELARTRLWVPLPIRRRPFTDGTAVRLPLVSSDGTDFVPAFTSAARLTAWADRAQAPRAAEPGEFGFERAGRRAGDARVVPHIVVPAVGLARRLPPGLGLALNPDAPPGIPLYPECVSYLGRLSPGEGVSVQGMPGMNVCPSVLIGHPPTEPTALLRETSAGLRTLPAVRQASRAWLTVPATGEGLVISVALDDPASETDRSDVVDALERACATAALRVPYPLDVTFPGESEPDLLDDWIARNTRPFYTREQE